VQLQGTRQHDAAEFLAIQMERASPDLSPGRDNTKLLHEAHLVRATPMFRNLAIRKTKHVPVKVSLDRSIEEQYDLLDLEVRLLQADRGIVLKY
jgi:hypothetical protein